MSTLPQHLDEREARIAVVDDERNIRELLEASLRFAGFEVVSAATGQEAIVLLLNEKVDLVVLDVMLPDLDGFEVTRRLRERGVTTPVLFLTARDDVPSAVTGLTVGGDDYVTKPFSLEELVARIRAVLRRTAGAKTESAILRYADLEIDSDAHEVRRAGRVIELLPHRVRAAALPHGERRPGALPPADPRPRVGLRLARRAHDRRVLHLLPAAQDRPAAARDTRGGDARPAHPHPPRARLRAQDPVTAT